MVCRLSCGLLADQTDLGLQLLLIQDLKALQVKKTHCKAQASLTSHTLRDLQRTAVQSSFCFNLPCQGRATTLLHIQSVAF